MRTLLPLLSLAALGAAAPADLGRREEIAISNMTVITTEQGEVTSVYFSLTGENATNLACQADGLRFPSEVYTCGDSKYRFALWKGVNVTYALRLYHELGVG
jgi:hypothetical protein